MPPTPWHSHSAPLARIDMPTCLLAIALTLGCATGPGQTPSIPEDRWLAEDKLRHFALSFAATEMTYGGARLILDHDAALPAAAATALALGIAKELRDQRAGGPFSLRDLAWDLAGVAAGVALVHNIR